MEGWGAWGGGSRSRARFARPWNVGANLRGRIKKLTIGGLSGGHQWMFYVGMILAVASIAYPRLAKK